MRIQLKSQKLQLEDVQIGHLYAKHDNNTVYYVSECYLDNHIEDGGKRLLLIQIGKEGKFTHMFKSKEELHSAMVGYSLKSADFEITQIS